MLGMGKDWRLDTVFGSVLLVQICVGSPAYVILWVPIVADATVGYPGLLVLDAGELQMKYVVAIGYNAIIVAFVVELVVLFPLVVP